MSLLAQPAVGAAGVGPAPLAASTAPPARDVAPAPEAAPEVDPPAPGSRPPRARLDLPGALRLAGGALLALSLSRFLLAGVAVENDLERFALLLLQTAVFTGAGFAVAHRLDDLKGARLLFGIALASVPAGFAVLGAMIHSVAGLELLGDGGPGLAPNAARELPAFARWQIASARDIGVAAAATALVLVPTTFFGFATLARRSAVRLGATLLASSALLLVPVREPILAGLLLLVASALALRTWRALAGTDDALATLEGRFALALLAVPAGIVAVRATVADEPGLAFATAGALVVLVAARTAMRALAPASRAHLALFPVAGLAILCTAPGIHSMLWHATSFDAAFVGTAALTGALVVELGRHSRTDRLCRTLELLWAAPVLIAATVACIDAGPEIAFSTACIAAVLAVAACRRRRSLGALALAAAAIASVGAFGGWFLDHRWEGLAAVGLATIVGAGVLQRRRGPDGSKETLAL